MVAVSLKKKKEEKEVVKNISRSFRNLFDVEFAELKKPEYKTTKTSFCGLGQEIVYIGSKGDISLCPALSEKEHVAGNILKNDFSKIWEYSPIFNQFRNPDFFTDSSCSDCKSFGNCVGGCRAKSVTFSGDFKSIDPWMCAFYKKD